MNQTQLYYHADKNQKPYVIGSGIVGADHPFRDAPIHSGNPIAFRQGNFACSHLTFRLALNSEGNGVNWVALRNSK